MQIVKEKERSESSEIKINLYIPLEKLCNSLFVKFAMYTAVDTIRIFCSKTEHAYLL